LTSTAVGSAELGKVVKCDGYADTMAGIIVGKSEFGEFEGGVVGFRIITTSKIVTNNEILLRSKTNS